MISREEAEHIAAKWVSDSLPSGTSSTSGIHEFDLGYVVSVQPQDEPIWFSRAIIDKGTGELSVWPPLPLETVIAQYRARQATRQPTLWTWDPAEQARWDLRHVATPANITHLRLPDRLVIARSVKGDREPRHHRLVLDFFRTGPAPEHRERGSDRCSEPAALSDALHAEDARRSSIGEPPIELEEARTGLFRGADLVTYRVRESGDPVAGTTAPPCVSCATLLRHLGFQLRPPVVVAGHAAAEGARDDA
jgi:hypothetical protein